jgi:hypothetical protein
MVRFGNFAQLFNEKTCTTDSCFNEKCRFRACPKVMRRPCRFGEEIIPLGERTCCARTRCKSSPKKRIFKDHPSKYCGDLTKWFEKNQQCKLDLNKVCNGEGTRWDYDSQECVPTADTTSDDAFENGFQTGFRKGRDSVDLSTACGDTTTWNGRACVANYDGDGINLYSKCSCWGWGSKTPATKADIMSHVK